MSSKAKNVVKREGNPFDANLKKLQKKLKEDGIAAYVVPVTDPHQSEYVAPRYSLERMSLCRFQGSDGTLLVTPNKAYLYTDGRYWVEAEEALEGTSVKLVKMGDFNVPPITEFIRRNGLYPLAMDFSLVSAHDFASFRGRGEGEIVDRSYRSVILPDEELPFSDLWKVDRKLLSNTYQKRVAALVEELVKKRADGTLISSLDDVAYLTGWRGNDVPCTPVFLSYLYVDKDGSATLFVRAKTCPEELPGLKVKRYDEVWPFLKKLGKEKGKRILLDPKRTNQKVLSLLPNSFFAPNPTQLHKSVKGKVEIENTKRIHELDALAVLKLWSYVEERVQKKGETFTEYELACLVDSYRLENERCYELSFPTIAAFRGHAAMMHYSPSKEGSSTVDNQGIDPILLVDSGGQYYGGTTDITRTFCLGERSEEYKVDYTLTVKSVLDLANAVFLQGCSGTALDIKARENMWRRGMDYKCGTGHGVGYMLNVHEGPNGFRYRVVPERDDSSELLPGQIQSDEPGVYKAGKYGVRIESELLTVRKFETSDGLFNGFEWITYCPLDGESVDPSLLSDEEIAWFNDYQKLCWNTLSPHLSNDRKMLRFLKDKTRPIHR